MLGVTSVNRCDACRSVHGRWGRHVGLHIDDVSPAQAAAYDYGQRLAVAGPAHARPPAQLSRRHRRELAASAILMELANLAGNRFLGSDSGGRAQPLQVGDARTARLLDVGMRVADRAGLLRARTRIAGRARGDVLELGVGTGSNLRSYPADAAIHGIDVSAPAMSIAAARALDLDRRVVLTVADAAALPFPDASFDTVVATFVLCSVGDVSGTLREARRVLRPGGTIRLLEHAEADHPVIASLQRRSAPAWARVSGGCRLDHDVRGAVRDAGLTVVSDRRRLGGILVEIVAAA
jgi:SAM-dependent methyltransferase